MKFFALPSLNYDYASLEPVLDEQTMIIHHTKHHQAYVDNTNSILEKLSLFKQDVSVQYILKNLNKVPIESRLTLKNNIGGYINHNMFWKILKRNTILKGKLKDAIEHNFNNFSNFKKIFEETAMKCFGSGWTWLVIDSNKLNIVSTSNQDNPIMGKSICGVSGYPILCLDLWEHSYYIKYKNRRLDYIKSFWDVVNWDEVSKIFDNYSIDNSI